MTDNKTTQNRFLAFILPILLISTTGGVFYAGIKIFNSNIAYLMGFVFYWLVWCLALPCILQKAKPLSFFRDAKPLFTKKNWWIILLLLSTIVSPIFMYTIPKLVSTPLAVVLLGIPLAIIHSFFEEIFWRGFYVKRYGKNWLFSVIIPTLFFALWHFAPQIAIPSDTPVIFVVSTLPLGFVYAFTAYATKSAKWSFIAHAISGILAFSGYLALSLWGLF